MEIQKLLQIREQKGYEIANKIKIVEQNGIWLVPSQSRNKLHKVILRLDRSTCTCEDFTERRLRCKHIFAVEISISKKITRRNGSTIITKELKYNWANYTKAQTEEGRLFKELLKDLVANVPEPIKEGAGRPRTPFKVGLFCAIDKVYSMQSSRRAYSRYKDAENNAQISKAPNYNVINILLNNKDLTPILKKLLEITSVPLKQIETKFAVDSTGFRTTRFNEYCVEKHNTKREHSWIKCHAICGITTNIITSVEITDEFASDSPLLIPLVESTVKTGFKIDEVSADKGYSSANNLERLGEIGILGFIPFKKNTRIPEGGNMWSRMYGLFLYHQDKFLQHYHLRSNIETTFFAVKTKFGDILKNKNFVSQTNELLCKLIAYNITVLISAMYELEIEPYLIS